MKSRRGSPDGDVYDPAQDVAEDQEGHHHVKAEHGRRDPVHDPKIQVVQKVARSTVALVVVPHRANQYVNWDLEGPGDVE